MGLFSGDTSIEKFVLGIIFMLIHALCVQTANVMIKLNRIEDLARQQRNEPKLSPCSMPKLIWLGLVVLSFTFEIFAVNFLPHGTFAGMCGTYVLFFLAMSTLILKHHHSLQEWALGGCLAILVILLAVAGPKQEDHSRSHVKIFLDNPATNFSLCGSLLALMIGLMILRASMSKDIDENEQIEPKSLFNIVCIATAVIASSLASAFSMLFTKSVFQVYDVRGWIFGAIAVTLALLHFVNIIYMGERGHALSAFPCHVASCMFLQQVFQQVVYAPKYQHPVTFYVSCAMLLLCIGGIIVVFQQGFENQSARIKIIEAEQGERMKQIDDGAGMSANQNEEILPKY